MNNKFTLTLFLAFIFSFTYVMAFGLGVPHQFYGNAEYNGAAANGLTIEAFIDGNNVGTTTTLNGRYGYEPVFYISDSEVEEYSGKTITFYLNGIDTGQTAVFENGASTRIDLSVGSAPSPPATSNPPSGGGGGGGGGGSSSRVCYEKWECTEWDDCEGGLQKRTCTDIKKCETTKIKPATLRSCSVDAGDNEENDLGMLETTDNEEPNFFSRLTGAVIGGGRGKYTIPLVFVVLIVIVAIGVYVKRKS